jgi:hypothetical protein
MAGAASYHTPMRLRALGAKVACYQVPTRLWAYPSSHIVSYRVSMRLWALHCQLPSADPPGALVHLPLQGLMLLQPPINGRHELHKAGLQAPPLHGAVSYQVPMRLVPWSTSLCRVSCCCSSPSKAVTSCTKLGRASASACQHCSAMDAYACGGGSSSRHGYRDQQDMSIEGRYDTGVTACQHCSAMEAHAC